MRTDKSPTSADWRSYDQFLFCSLYCILILTNPFPSESKTSNSTWLRAASLRIWRVVPSSREPADNTCFSRCSYWQLARRWHELARAAVCRCHDVNNRCAFALTDVSGGLGVWSARRSCSVKKGNGYCFPYMAQIANSRYLDPTVLQRRPARSKSADRGSSSAPAQWLLRSVMPSEDRQNCLGLVATLQRFHSMPKFTLQMFANSVSSLWVKSSGTIKVYPKHPHVS